MKLKHLLALLLAPAIIASCSDDNTPENLADDIAGNYDGYTVAECAYFSGQVATDQSLTIAQVSGAANQVSISFSSSTWGTISIPAATVAKQGDSYLISGSGTSVMGMGGNSSEYACELTGTITDGKASLSFSCAAIMGGLTIHFEQGDIPASTVVPGTYKGYTKADCAYFHDMYADNQTLEIALSGENSFKVSFTSDTWGEFSIDNATATSEGNTFSLSGTGTCKMGMGGNVSEYSCSFTGTVDAEKDSPEFVFTAPIMGGLTIVFKTGDMPQTAE